MKKARIRIVSLIAAILIVFQCVPAAAFADEVQEENSTEIVLAEEKAAEERTVEVKIVREDLAELKLEEEAKLEEKEKVEEAPVVPAVTTYQITWQNEDGSVLAVSSVEKGKTPAYEGETPVKEADLHYTYTFSGWTPKLKTAYADAVYTATYTKTAIKYKVTLNFVDIRKADGTTTTATESNMLGAGSGWNFTQKKLDNKVSVKSFTYRGVKYTYTGQWILDDGTVFSGTYKINGNDLTGDLTITLRPVYESAPIWYLNYQYIDNISTGSGSWSNTGSFDGYTHTFKQPESRDHYLFVNWTEDGSGKVYMPGESYTFPSENKVSGSTTTVKTYAMWQPSATIRYYSADGSVLLNEVEAFETLSVYDYTPETGSDSFLGWYAAPGAAADGTLAGDTVCSLPAITSVPVERTILNVYARTASTYSAEYYLEDLNGEFVLAEDETESYENAIVGSEAEAEVKDFEGFSLNTEASEISGIVAENGGLVLKAYYSRNSYTVSYKYDGTIPSNATELPGEASVKFGAEVKIADNASAKGYTFSGWDTEDFNMPAEDVVITGSFKANAKPSDVTPPAAAPVNPVNPVKDDEPEDEPAIVIPSDTTVPQARPIADIEDIIVPTASVKTWALVNLLCAVSTGILSLGMLLSFFRKDEDGKRRGSKILGILPAAAGVIAFMLTENTRNLMVLTDRWTLVMAAILVVNIILAIATRNRRNNENDKDAEVQYA